MSEQITPVVQKHARLAFIFGFLGIFLCFIGIFQILALIFGIVGLIKITKSNDPSIGGKGRAIFGIVIGAIFVVLPTIGAIISSATGAFSNLQ